MLLPGSDHVSLGDPVPAFVPQEHAYGDLRECSHKLLVLRHWDSAERSGYSHLPVHHPLTSKTPPWGCAKAAALTLTSATHIPALHFNLLQH